MLNGSLVLFFQHGELVSGLCTQYSDGRLQVLCADGCSFMIPAQRIVHAQPLAGVDAGDQVQVSDALAAAEQLQVRLAASVRPEALWKALDSTPCVCTCDELARAAFGAAAGSDHAAAVVRALQHERVYFKFNGEHYCALAPEQVEQARQRAEQEHRLQAEIELCAEWLHAFVNGQDPDGPGRSLCAPYLRQCAVFGSSAPQYAHIRAILKRAGLAPDRRQCFDLLVRMGVCEPDENLLLERYAVPCTWPAGVLQEIEKPSELCAPERGELLAIDVWSIDDPGTRDIDDAISCEQEDGGLRLGIHITDAASLLPSGSWLDREAARRGTSLYLPEGVIPMLPPELSEKRLSLIAGEMRPVVSVFVSLGSDGTERSRSLQLSTVRVSRRLSYNDVDTDIFEDGMFRHLYDVLMRVRDQRRAAGASAVSMPELQVRLDRHRAVELSVRERETPAQALVAECMILANHSAALFFRNNSVPALFRTQKPGRSAAALRRDDLPLSERVRLRHAFNRTVVETQARVHAGLGLDCYCSITSPLRKYCDLVMQRQLSSALQGHDPAYAREQLDSIAAALLPVLTRSALVESERRRYWLFKALEPLRGRMLQGCVLSRRKKHYTVLLTDYMLEFSADPPDDRVYEAGHAVQVLLRDINPFDGTICLKIV
jgi:exoribonuclease II